jgi:hypothetical protein
MAALTIVEFTEENLGAAVAVKCEPGPERYVARVTASLAHAFVTQEATLEFTDTGG